MMEILQPLQTPSEWVVRWSHLLPPHCTVLDVACGAGRHLHWFAERGHSVTGVDIAIDRARQAVPQARLVRADIENQPWPFSEHAEQFGAVVVTNYLHRPLFPMLLRSLAPHGVLLYETFAHGNAEFGRPRRPEFLLQPNELLQVCADWGTDMHVDIHVVAYENSYFPNPSRCVQRIAAIRSH